MRIRSQASGIRNQWSCRGYAAPVRSADKNLIPDCGRVAASRRGTHRRTPCGCSCPLIPDRGFTLIELFVVISIVAILAGVLLNRLQVYQEQAEKAAMQQVAGALQSALTLQYGRLITRGLEADAPALAVQNPMSWLAKIPNNYSGEFYDVTPRSVAPGNWVFDLKTRNLIYVVDHGDHFIPGKDGHKWVRYHVNLLYEAVPGAPGTKTKELVGTLFEPIERYRWFD